MDELLYKKLRNREEAAYDEIILQYSKLLWAVASTIITQRTTEAKMDIEEVVSDVFLRFWQHPEKFNPQKGSLKSYLAMMTRSMALNKIKGKQRHQHEEMDELHTLYAVKGTSSHEEEVWQQLYEAVMQLEEPTRQILIWRFFYEMKPAEITQRTGLSAKEIDNRLYRGKKKLREYLEYQNYLTEVDKL